MRRRCLVRRRPFKVMPRFVPALALAGVLHQTNGKYLHVRCDTGLVILCRSCSECWSLQPKASSPVGAPCVCDML